MTISEKISTIHDICLCGLDVIHVIHKYGLYDNTALEVEAALIDAYRGASNETSGRGIRERERMSAAQIQETYKSDTIDLIAEKCILIKINQPSVDRFGGNITKNVVPEQHKEFTRMSGMVNMLPILVRYTYVVAFGKGCMW